MLVDPNKEEGIKDKDAHVTREPADQSKTKPSEEKTNRSGANTNPADVIDQYKNMLPAESCVICERTLAEVGGRRIIAQKFRSVGVSTTKQGGGNPEFPAKSLELTRDPLVFMVVKGSADMWTQPRIEAAKNTYLSGLRPWFCQNCGNRTCSSCDAPVNRPPACDILYDDGGSAHASILPVDCGCCNPKCKKYREWGN